MLQQWLLLVCLCWLEFHHFCNFSEIGSITIISLGLLTALISAFAAINQDDIKKVLAYSTISQLGFMFIAIGAGAYVAAIFHLVTHAFFKALLFLGAGGCNS